MFNFYVITGFIAFVLIPFDVWVWMKFNDIEDDISIINRNNYRDRCTTERLCQVKITLKDGSKHEFITQHLRIEDEAMTLNDVIFDLSQFKRVSIKQLNESGESEQH